MNAPIEPCTDCSSRAKCLTHTSCETIDKEQARRHLDEAVKKAQRAADLLRAAWNELDNGTIVASEIMAGLAHDALQVATARTVGVLRNVNPRRFK